MLAYNSHMNIFTLQLLIRDNPRELVTDSQKKAITHCDYLQSGSRLLIYSIYGKLPDVIPSTPSLVLKSIQEHFEVSVLVFRCLALVLIFVVLFLEHKVLVLKAGHVSVFNTMAFVNVKCSHLSL